MKKIICIICACLAIACTKESIKDSEKTGNTSKEEIINGPITMRFDSSTATTATFSGTIQIPSEYVPDFEVGLIYYENKGVSQENPNKVRIGDASFEVKITDLLVGTEYCFTSYVVSNGITEYGEIQTFSTEEVSIDISLDKVLADKVSFSGKVSGLSPEDDGVKICLSMSLEEKSLMREFNYINPSEGGTWKFTSLGLSVGTNYYYAVFVKCKGVITFSSEVMKFTTVDPYSASVDFDSAQDLSLNGSANCYVVSTPGHYKIKSLKGNSNEFVGDISQVDILWEYAKEGWYYGDLICGKGYSDKYLGFVITEPFKEGNALIAAKDSEGNVMWSWHIWLTDKPKEHVYNNDAGIMMDRNLGAVDVYDYGFIYQWGRKDPLHNRGANEYVMIGPKSIDWTIKHPEDFVYSYSNDWCISGDNTRWQSQKTIYDPCPAGWRIPDGGDESIWTKALDGSWDSLELSYEKLGRLSYSAIDNNKSLVTLANDVLIYPFLDSYDPSFVDGIVADGYYWTCNFPCLSLDISSDGSKVIASPYDGENLVTGGLVRCQKE